MRIFISYKTENRPFALHIRAKLVEWGFETWIDIHDIPKGTYWPDEIDKALQVSDVIIGIMSPLAVDSRNVKNEWDWAIVNGKRLILIMHQECYVPMNYISINYILCAEEELERGLSQLREALTKPQKVEKTLDAYQEYLQKLYYRINSYLGQKIIPTLRNDEGLVDPIRLQSESTPDAVDALFAKQWEIDPLFQSGGIQFKQDQHDFESLQEAFDYYDGRMLLLGEPGSGKTISLLQLGRDATIRRLQDSSQPLPILGIIPTWNAEKQESIADWFGKAYGSPENVSDIILNGKGLLLLDGLDELAPEMKVDKNNPDSDVIVPRKVFLDILPPNNKIIITSRLEEFFDIDSKARLNGAVKLKKLGKSQIFQYLSNHENLQAMVQSDEQLIKLLQLPLTIALFTFAFHEAGVDWGNQRQGETSSEWLIERYVKNRYAHEKSRQNIATTLTLEELVDYLGMVAIYNLNSEYSPDNLFKEYHFSRAGIPESLVKQIREIALRMNILIYVNETYSFQHLMIRSHFAHTYGYKILEVGNIRQKSEVATALAKLGNPQTIEKLVALLEGTNRRIPAYISALGILRSEKSSHILIGALEDENPFVRQNAVIALGGLRNRETVPALLKCLEDTDVLVKYYAVNALGAIGDTRAVPKLIELIKQRDTGIRRHTAHAIGTLSEVSEEKESFQRIRIAAVNALEKFNSPEAKEAVNSFRKE